MLTTRRPGLAEGGGGFAREQLNSFDGFGRQVGDFVHARGELAVDHHHRAVYALPQVDRDFVEQVAHGIVAIARNIRLAELVLDGRGIERAVGLPSPDDDRRLGIAAARAGIVLRRSARSNA
jgi:hypothetical protein